MISLEQVINFVTSLLKERGLSLSDMERYALEAAWTDKKYAEISEKYSVSLNVLQVQAGPAIWRKLTNIFDRKVGKKSLRKVITKEILEAEAKALYLKEKGAASFVGASLPPVEGFIGRHKELDDLCRLVNKHSCLILTGAEGSGKKSLLSKLLLSMQHKLPIRQVLWKTLRHQPGPKALEAELHSLVSDSPAEGLIEALMASPHLIVLDSLDSILNFDDANEPVLDEQYTSLFRRCSEETLSRIVILSNQPTAVTDDMILRGRALSYHLKGLTLDESKILLGRRWDVESAEEVWKMTGGSPLILRELANWSDYAEELNPQLNRMTVIAAIVGNHYQNMIRRLRLSVEDMTLLQEIIKHTKGLAVTHLLAQRPRSIANARRLINMGIASREFNDEGETVIRVIPLIGRALTGT